MYIRISYFKIFFGGFVSDLKKMRCRMTREQILYVQ